MADPVDIPVSGEGDDDEMATEVNGGVMEAVMSGMAKAAAAQADIRIRRFDQLAGDTASMWVQYLASPSILAAMGFRVAQQSGGFPADTGTGTGGN